MAVSDLEIADKTHGDTFLPYPLLRYNIVNGGLLHRNKMVESHIVDVESIFRPAILIPCPDRSQNFGEKIKNEKPRNATQDECTHFIRLWGIPYKILDRAGYNLALPTAQGDPLFLNDDNINAIHDWAHEEQSASDEHNGDNSDFDDVNSKDSDLM